MTKADLIKEWNRAYRATIEVSQGASHAYFHTNDKRFEEVYKATNEILWNLPVIRTKDRKAEIEQKVNELFERWDKVNKLLLETLDAYYLDLARKN